MGAEHVDGSFKIGRGIPEAPRVDNKSQTLEKNRIPNAELNFTGKTQIIFKCADKVLKYFEVQL